MAILNTIKGVLGQAAAAEMPALVSSALGNTKFGNLQNLVDHLGQGPLAAHVQSWVGDGKNLPVSADQLRAALGNEHVRQIAQGLGIDPDAALNVLAQHLPGMVEQASKQGTVTVPS